MVTPQPIPLAAIPTFPNEPRFQAILTWPFAERPFFEGQVKRLLRNDIPHRMTYGFCFFSVFLDPAGNTVGFGVLEVSKEYERFTNGKYHCYIPLLAVHPNFKKRGHGRSIVQHLIADAVLFARSPSGLSDLLFLDVYMANAAAISLYEKCGFLTLNPDNAIPDPQENNEPYIIMAKKVVVTPAVIAPVAQLDRAADF